MTASMTLGHSSNFTPPLPPSPSHLLKCEKEKGIGKKATGLGVIGRLHVDESYAVRVFARDGRNTAQEGSGVVVPSEGT